MRHTVGIPARWRQEWALPGIRCWNAERQGSLWLVVVGFHHDGEADSSYQVMVEALRRRAAQEVVNEDGRAGDGVRAPDRGGGATGPSHGALVPIPIPGSERRALVVEANTQAQRGAAQSARRQEIKKRGYAVPILAMISDGHLLLLIIEPAAGPPSAEAALVRAVMQGPG
jgi:hypothetical protein